MPRTVNGTGQNQGYLTFPHTPPWPRPDPRDAYTRAYTNRVDPARLIRERPYNRVMPRLFPNVDAFLALPVRERLKSAAGLRAVGGQVAIENILNNALLYFPSFYAVQSLYQGGRAIDGLAKFRASWREDVPAIWSFWVPVQTLNFLVSPLWARVPVTAAASLLWTSYVSFSRGCPGPCPQNAPTRCDGVRG